MRMDRAGTPRVRLLRQTGIDGHGPVSRIADRIEAAQLGLANRLLGRAREMIAVPGAAKVAELGLMAEQLADALRDALLIAEYRGVRLDAVEDMRGTMNPGPADSSNLCQFSLPGDDLASGPAARHRVRAEATAWGLPPETLDDLESITGELVANALEHSDSRAITIACALTADTLAVSVTDGGSGCAPVVPVPMGQQGPRQENGRGLLITDALADRWGTRRSGRGLEVWAEVAVRTTGGVPT
ncbi:ATP-binding protein [Streptomyces geranii]|uniref:ATP-binding protein n=1 Tax=Streptomyces geranii TaxID=2058923 RepID=UPI0013001E1C|nr:ATP-binding protein [Streptomyces geranii]